MATLYLMLGYPGAGKSTTSRIINQLTGATHLMSDQIRLELFPNPRFTPEEHSELYRKIDTMTHDLLAEGKDVIYDANLNRYIHRKEKYGICAATGAKPVLVWVRAPEALARQRATVLRIDDNEHPFDNLSEQVFNRLINEIEPPREPEPTIELDGTKITPEYVRSRLGL